MEYSASSRSHLLSLSALLWPLHCAGKKAGADPRTGEREREREGPSANFSKARVTAIAIIPNEKVTAAAALGIAMHQADRCCPLYFTSGSRRNLFSRYRRR